MSESISDEQAVVGEPASHPHQAVVVGEPPEGMPPVVGEPLLSNGVGDRQPISPPSTDETSINGVQTPAPLQSGLDAPPASQSSSQPNSFSAAPSEDISNLPEVPVAEEHSPSESRSVEAPVEEGAHRSDLPAAESAHPSESHVDENSTASDATAIESTNAVDAPAECAADSHDARPSEGEEPASDIHDAVEVTHIAETPSEGVLPVTEVPGENPFQALDEASGVHEKTSGESLTNEDPVTDRSLAEQASDANILLAQDETTAEEPGDFDAAHQQEEGTIPLAATQEELSTEHVASTPTALDVEPSEDSKDSEPVKEELHCVKSDQASHEDAPIQEGDASKASPADIESAFSEVEPSLAAQPPNQVSERDASVQENDTRVEIPVGSGTLSSGVEQVLSRETPISEVLIEESPIPQEEVFHGDHAAPKSAKTPAEAAAEDSPAVSQDTLATSVDEGFVDQLPTEEASFPCAANGDNGFHHGEDGNHPLEREQDLSKDDDESAEGKGKPSSFLKMPLIVTGLAIAAVGVAVASFSRPH